MSTDAKLVGGNNYALTNRKSTATGKCRLKGETTTVGKIAYPLEVLEATLQIL
jgi:hypothetical protein